jgi:hypothetical protein
MMFLRSFLFREEGFRGCDCAAAGEFFVRKCSENVIYIFMRGLRVQDHECFL